MPGTRKTDSYKYCYAQLKVQPLSFAIKNKSRDSAVNNAK